MTYLIDGYNLLHAVGWVPGGKLPGGALEAARRRLLDWLADAPSAKREAARFRVVFDAQKGPGESPERSHRGVWYRFAFRRTADEVIEELLDWDPTPKAVTVVTNDMQILEAARRCGSGGWRCQAFVDWLLAPEPSPDASEDAPEKPTGPPPPAEAAALLAVFDLPQPRLTRRLT